MTPSQVYCVLDYETYSEAPLGKQKGVGSYEYSAHPSTEIICAAWRTGTKAELRKAPTLYWVPDGNGDAFGDLYHALMSPDVILVAHNALFEQCITRNVFAVKYMYSKKAEIQALSPERWLCTASLAAALAIPRNLEGAASALGLPVQKDMVGAALIKKWCKPRKLGKANKNPRHDDPAELKRLIEYCKVDVAAEVELFLRAPPLTEKERKVWCLDQAINLRGFLVDRPLVKTVLDMVADETEVLNSEAESISRGGVTKATQRAKVMQFLDEWGYYLPDMKKETIEEWLASGRLEGPALRMLQIRAEVCLSSTAKYRGFDARSKTDGRLRDILIYHGASTGRWGGAGIQPHNFPRGTIPKGAVTGAIETLKEGDVEMVRLLYGDPMAVFSSCLRGMIIAPKDRVFDVADYNAIEARVLFWLARHESGLRAFREGRDLYKEQAAQIFGVSVDTIGDESLERFLGKSAILGCGFQMGAKKFRATCAKQGQDISEDLAKRAVSSYRQTNAPVVQLWAIFEMVAVAAVQNPGKNYATDHTIWFVKDGFLWCQLPSGRRLAYYGPEVRYEETPWGDSRPVLYHWSVKTPPKLKEGEKKGRDARPRWMLTPTYGGRLTENITQAVARDVMAEAMLRIDATGLWDIVLSVHDELIAERKKTYQGCLKDFVGLMEVVPDWAKGLPVLVKGWSGRRYRK